MMQLTRLMETYSKVLDWAGGRVEVRGVVADLRQVQPGYLLVAIPGAGVNDCRMISEALKGGAVAIAGERPAEELNDLPWGDFTYVQVQDAMAAWHRLRDSWGWLCRIGAVPV
jgi:UDP-N-acetylmuramyl tripeptide synthase